MGQQDTASRAEAIKQLVVDIETFAQDIESLKNQQQNLRRNETRLLDRQNEARKKLAALTAPIIGQLVNRGDECPA
jgi:succinate dehydrogenase/fumarate reductase-like Fe-S protein